MKKTFKKYFIPHESNEHKPHILRARATMVILVAIFVFELLFLSQVYVVAPRSNFLALILPQVLVDLTNTNRSQNAEVSLAVNPLLEVAARLKAEDMAAKGYFAHVSPEGVTPWHWFSTVGYAYASAGENLAVNFSDSEDVVRAWMNSEGHRKNILNGNFTEIGIGTAKGVYKGRDVIFIAQLFARPYYAAVALNAPITAKTSPEPVKSAPSIIPPATAPKLLAENNVKGAEMFIETQTQVLPEVINNQAMPKAAPTNSLVENNAPAAATPLAFRWLSAPRKIMNNIYLSIMGFMALALILKIFIRIRIQHPFLILNGLVVLAVLTALLWGNQYLLNISALIV